VALALGQLVRLGAGLGVNVMLMRVLGVEGFGTYGYVVTLVGLGAWGAGLGMHRLINRELARQPERADRLVATGTVATLGLSALTLLAIVGAALALDGRPVVLAAATLGGLAMGVQTLAMVPEAAFHAARRMRFSVRAQIAGRTTLVSATALFLFLDLGFVSVFVAQALDAAVTLGLLWLSYRRHLGTPSLRTSWPEVRALVVESVPFGLNLLFGSVYLSSDVLLLAVLKDDHEVGVYRGAVMVIALFPVLANTLTTGIYPRMARHLGDRVAAGGELHFASRMLLAVSVPAAVGGILVAEELMVFLGGAEFAVSAVPFVIMAPLLPLRFLNNGYAMTLSTLNRQDDRTRGVFLAALLNLGANLAVIPTWGAAGAAATTLLTEVALAVWFRWHIRPLVTGLHTGQTLLRVALPAALMAGGLLLLPPVHVLLQVAVGVVIYAVVGLLSGAWHPRDLPRLRRV